jgi:hypothetical protein
MPKEIPIHPDVDPGKKDSFIAEIEEIEGNVCHAIRTILLSHYRTTKYNPYNWAGKDESENSHLQKGMRHILTYLLQRDGWQDKDDEDHLFFAISRLGMALSIRERAKKP